MNINQQRAEITPFVLQANKTDVAAPDAVWCGGVQLPVQYIWQWRAFVTSGRNILKFLLIQPYPFTQIVRVELECQRDFSDITLVFNHLLDSFKPEPRGKGTFSPTSFDHASPHFHCFNINRISRCPELPIHYIHVTEPSTIQTQT